MAPDFRRDRMAWAGDPPWHGRGRRVRGNVTAHEMMVAAHSDPDSRVTEIPVASRLGMTGDRHLLSCGSSDSHVFCSSLDHAGAHVGFPAEYHSLLNGDTRVAPAKHPPGRTGRAFHILLCDRDKGPAPVPDIPHPSLRSAEYPQMSPDNTT